MNQQHLFDAAHEHSANEESKQRSLPDDHPILLDYRRQWLDAWWNWRGYHYNTTTFTYEWNED